MQKIWLCLSFLVVFVTQPTTAYAYLDPGTMTYIIQILVAGLIGGIYGLRYYILKIFNKLTGRESKSMNDDETTKEQDQKESE